MDRCPSLEAVHRACPFLTNGHVETIFAAVARKSPGVQYYRRCVIMPDGAAIALDYELLPPELVSAAHSLSELAGHLSDL